MSERDVIDAFDLRLIENRKFSFAWLTNQEGGAMITRPKLTNVTVTSEPEWSIEKYRLNLQIIRGRLLASN